MSIWSNLFNKEVEKKEVPQGVAFSDTNSRGAIDKAYFPGFLVKPPFGFPKYKNIYELRRVASVPQAASAISTIIDEVTSIPWDIVSKDSLLSEDEITKARREEVKQFFINPNTNKEDFRYILKVVLKDLLEIDSGIIVKEFNKRGQMVEIRASDGAGFLKNPDIYGKYTERDDLILEGFVNYDPERNGNTLGQTNAYRGGLTVQDAQRRAAYFQYGYLTSARPVPFGKREVVWIEKNPISYDIYGRSAIENLYDILQTLIYAIQYDVEYFEDNNVPKGFIQLAGASQADLNAFKERWNDMQLKRDTLSGKLRKIFHRVPITNSPNAEFKRVQFTSQELELISKQQWFSKLVWMAFGVTPSELGFTEDSNRATDVSQSRVFKRRIIVPLVELLEFYINKEIVSEWGYDDIEFKFKIFDAQEEITKYQLYQLQLNSKIKSINEIRKEEGLSEVEWGKNPMDFMQSFGLNPIQKPEETEKTDAVEADKDRKMKSLSVAQTTGNITLTENEVISYINKYFKEKEKEIIEILKRESKKDRLSQIKIKSINDVSKKIDDLFNFDNFGDIVKKAVADLYSEGWTAAEKKTNRNMLLNKEQIKFLQDYTFGNIKGAEQDFKNKLRQELKRAIINGYGIGKIIEKVKDTFDDSQARAEAIARTELNRAENQGELQAMKSIGRKVTKTWIAAKDDRTSVLCKRLDGQTVDVNEKFKDGSEEWDCPPSHVNCRSTVIYNVD